MRIIFYCSSKDGAIFIDDEGVEKLGELSIDIGRPFQSVEDKTVKVTLVFGSTYISATATNKEGSEIRNCEFEFQTSGASENSISPKKKLLGQFDEEEKTGY